MINKLVKREEPVSQFINVAAYYDDDTLIDKSGKLIRIIKLAGLDVVTKDQQKLHNLKNSRNNLLKSFSSEFAIYCWEIRKKSLHYPDGELPEGYASEVNEKYKQKIQQSDMFHAELYIGIITKHPEGVVNK